MIVDLTNWCDKRRLNKRMKKNKQKGGDLKLREQQLQEKEGNFKHILEFVLLNIILNSTLIY